MHYLGAVGHRFMLASHHYDGELQWLSFGCHLVSFAPKPVHEGALVGVYGWHIAGRHLRQGSYTWWWCCCHG